jgi:hypothetical protein
MNQLATTQAFQERMFAKIRDQMGDLMTDDDLRNLVAAAMQKAFFEPRESADRYTTRRLPPLFVELITELMTVQVKTAVTQWVEANPDTVSKAITAAIEKGVHGMVMSSFESKVQSSLTEFENSLRARGVI